jgi:hypothetical protein
MAAAWPSSIPHVAVARARVRNRQGKVSSVVHNDPICAGGRPTAATWVDVLGLPIPLPSLPTPCHWGPISGAQAVSSSVADNGFAPWVVIVVMQVFSSVPSVRWRWPLLGSGYGVPPGFNRVRQGPPRGSAVGTQGGGAACVADRQLAPPLKVGSFEASSTSMAAGIVAQRVGILLASASRNGRRHGSYHGEPWRRVHHRGLVRVPYVLLGRRLQAWWSPLCPCLS